MKALSTMAYTSASDDMPEALGPWAEALSEWLSEEAPDSRATAAAHALLEQGVFW